MLEGLGSKSEFGKVFQEQEFTFTPGLTPLNHGSYGAVPRRMQEVQIRLLTEQNAHPDIWFRGNDHKYWTESVEAAAKFFHCDQRDLVFVTNATEGVNTILKSYDFKEGESILSTSLTYGSVSLTCRDVAAKNKVITSEVLDIKFPIACDEDVLKQYEEYFQSHPNTRIVIIDHITSTSGVLMPAKKIAKLCSKYGILSLVDGAHAPGQIPLDFEDLDVDFYTGNFHKWLFTPRGCAVLYVNRKHHDWVKPLVTSWWTDKSLGEQFAKIGTCDIIPYVCAKYALEFHEKIGGMERISSYTSHLSSEAQNYLVGLFKTEKLKIPDEMEAPNLKVVLLPDVTLPNGKTALEDFFMTLQQRTGIQTACVEIQGRKYVRLSTTIYNYMEEYKRLGDAMLEYINELNQSQTEKTKTSLS